MAAYLLNITKSLQRLTFNSQCRHQLTLLKELNPIIYSKNVLFDNAVRTSTNFFNKLPADALWKGITSVSNAGKKRGRGKTISKKNIKDLNRGQIIGVGKANIVWPGLSVPIIRGKELVEQQQLPEDPEREKKLIQLRDKMGIFRYAKINPIDRGWTGARLPGRSIGAPDAVGEDTFEGFDSKVLEFKTVFNMKGNLGRKRRLSAFIVTGNGNGLAGFATGKALDTKAALRKAKNRSGQKLMHIKIFRDHTILHDFFTQFGSTKIFVSQRPKGHGLVCHRAIKTICEVIGIKDLYAKVEGSTNVQHITKAFFMGLLKQKSHEQLAEEKKLHLVEFCKESSYFPTVLASPSECRFTKDIKGDEILDLTQHSLGGRVILKRRTFPPFYTKHRSWAIYLKKHEKVKNQFGVRLNMLVEKGEIRSYLTDKYPECRPARRPPKVIEEEETAQ